MAFVSVTRLRVRSLRFLPLFFVYAVRSQRQVQASPGFLGGSLLPDKSSVFWTLTVWEDAASMRAYMLSGAHKTAMPKLMLWCDEASVAHWTKQGDTIPTWQEAEAAMRTLGRPSRVDRPSADHASMAFAVPRSYAGNAIRVRTPAS